MRALVTFIIVIVMLHAADQMGKQQTVESSTNKGVNHEQVITK